MTSTDHSGPVGFTSHDHETCVADSLKVAETHCAENGLRFTPVRRRALEILLEGHHAMGAYDVLERLQAEGLGSQPPAAYRALDFLVTNGLAHRVEKLNAYVACVHPGEDHVPAFLVCRSCDVVAEATAQPGEGWLEQAAKDSGFQIERTVVEADGLCRACAASQARESSV